MPDESIVVVGAGFVPMIPGAFANTVIPPPQAEQAPINLEVEAPSPPEPSIPLKSLPSKSSPPSKAPGA